MAGWPRRDRVRLLVSVAGPGPAPAADIHPIKPLRIGILAPEGEAEAFSDWRQVGDALGRALPEYAVRLDYFSLGDLRDAVANRRLDFAITNSGHYVELEAAYGMHRIATLDNARAPSPDRAVASAVVVRADRGDLRRLVDLRGKRLLAIDAHAFGGYQLSCSASALFRANGKAGWNPCRWPRRWQVR